MHKVLWPNIGNAYGILLGVLSTDWRYGGPTTPEQCSDRLIVYNKYNPVLRFVKPMDWIFRRFEVKSRAVGAKGQRRGQKRRRLVAIRLSDEEYAAIVKVVGKLEKQAGLPIQLSGWIRRAIREQLKREIQN